MIIILYNIVTFCIIFYSEDDYILSLSLLISFFIIAIFIYLQFKFALYNQPFRHFYYFLLLFYSAVMIDRDLKEVNSIEAVFPYAVILLCWYVQLYFSVIISYYFITAKLHISVSLIFSSGFTCSKRSIAGSTLSHPLLEAKLEVFI